MKENVNFIKHVTETFRRFADDSRGTGNHRMLYMALFDCWNRSYFRTTISICRDEVMRISGIRSTSLYYKCIKDLDAWGYISYEPSNSIYAGSKIEMRRFDTCDDMPGDQPDDQLNTQLNDQLQVQSINSSNYTARIHPFAEEIAERPTAPVDQLNDQLDTQLKDQLVTPSINKSNLPAEAEGGTIETTVPVLDKRLDWLTQPDPDPMHDPYEEEEDTAAYWESTYMPDREVQPPSFDEVVEFFEGYHFDKRDARTFFKYYEALGWVGKRKVPIEDWQMYAKCWIGHIARCILNGLRNPKWQYVAT